MHWLAPAERNDAVVGERPLALSYASGLLLARVGAQTLQDTGTAIHSVHVSQRGSFGRVTLTAEDAGVSALGYVVAYREVRAQLLAAAAQAGLAPHPSPLASAEQAAEVIHVQCTDGGLIEAKLLVRADGSSALRRDYQSVAVTAEVDSAEPPRGRAFERFTSEGPIALLPRARGYALVWTLPAARAQEIAALSADAFRSALQRAFGGAAGVLTATRAISLHPLALRVAGNTSPPRTLAIGNAAQSLHPVAGQGLNLGLRDVGQLVHTLALHAHDPGAAAALAAYHARRRVDRWLTIGVTDVLARAFLPDASWLRGARSVALAALGGFAPARRLLARQMIYGVR